MNNFTKKTLCRLCNKKITLKRNKYNPLTSKEGIKRGNFWVCNKCNEEYFMLRETIS